MTLQTLLFDIFTNSIYHYGILDKKWSPLFPVNCVIYYSMSYYSGLWVSSYNIF